MTLMQNTLNGPNPQTHTGLFEHADYEGVQTWAQRIAMTSRTFSKKQPKSEPPESLRSPDA